MSEAHPRAMSEGELRAALEKVHSWIVCYSIASPEDMAQSFPEMEKIIDAALRSRPTQPQANAGWRSIETAPKDGTEILLFRPAKCGRPACYAAARWLGYKERVPRWGWVMARSDETVAVFDEPLCWTHLPEPPNAFSTTSVQEAEVAARKDGA